MAEVAVNIPVNLEKIEPKFSPRRNSTGSLGIETREAKVLPHYLLRSTGSCHDLCKSGCKRDLETKAKTPMLKTFASTLNKSIDPTDSVDLQKKKKSFGTTKPPLDSTSRTTNQFARKETSSSSKKSVSATNPSLSNLRPLKIQVPSCATAQPSSRRRFSEIIIPITNQFTRKETSSSFKKSVSATNPSLSKLRPLKIQVPSCPTAQPSSRRRFSEIIIPKRSGDFEMNPPGGSESRRNSETKLVNDTKTTKVSKKKVLVPPDASPSNKSSSKRVLKNQKSLTKAKTKQVCDQTVIEKTLYIIEPEAENQVTGIVQGTSLSNDSSLCQSPSFKERDCQNQMFRRGKAIDIQSEKTSPKRFGFRLGKVLAENQNGNIDASEKSLRRTEANGKTNEAGNSYIEVNLRHQAVEEKKDSQNSLNNVIEETASKLVKTRKSRVMALVGAFETVISLQDTKYSQTSRR